MTARFVAETYHGRALARAASERPDPVIVAANEIVAVQIRICQGRRFKLNLPHIGDWRPEGWRATGNVFIVDCTGSRRPKEPAITLWALLDKLKPGYGYATVERWDSWVRVQEFVPPREEKPHEP